MEQNTDRLFPNIRPRRMRHDEFSRRLMRENQLSTDDLIYPMFICEGKQQRNPVTSMPGIDVISIDVLVQECETLVSLGIPAIALFPNIATALKDNNGKESYNDDGLVQRAVRAIKHACPTLGVEQCTAECLYHYRPRL